ncbi:hypothetical protein Patl1_14860 [Pistacia atlantica]|uniref:Uncharacterized protein n=1 Tax=Pistacia atlantica TaxID=434234 RepID=A0ACC1AWY9_9ROSI|nr:hypothetical protein Patl1_14860 [Pistacia atlantica]
MSLTKYNKRRGSGLRHHFFNQITNSLSHTNFMAMASSSSLHQLLFPKHRYLSRNSMFAPPLRFSSPVRATATSSVTLQQDVTKTLEADLFCCPICYQPLIRKGPPGLNLPAIYRSGFKCDKCDRSFSSKDNYLDLTLISGLKDYVEVKPASTELFRSPFVSFLYERGWRQNFNRSGFPGPDEEFKMAQEYFKPVEGGLLVDVSCGKCYDFIKQDDTILTSNLALVRADVSRLPFSSGSVDAVHAGAALHCWPSPSNAVSVVSP